MSYVCGVDHYEYAKFDGNEFSFFFKPEISVLSKFGPETQNFLFAMKDKT